MYWPKWSCTLSAGNFDICSQSEKTLGEIVKRTFVIKNLQSEVGTIQVYNKHNSSLVCDIYFGDLALLVIC